MDDTGGVYGEWVAEGAFAEWLGEAETDIAAAAFELVNVTSGRIQVPQSLSR